MANYKTSIKDIRRNAKRRIRNRYIRSKVRTLYKKVGSSIEEKKPKEEVLKVFNEFSSEVDRAARKGIFHKNFAARNKSRFNKLINVMN